MQCNQTLTGSSLISIVVGAEVPRPRAMLWSSGTPCDDSRIHVDPPSSDDHFTQSIVRPNSCFGADIDRIPCVSREYVQVVDYFPYMI